MLSPDKTDQEYISQFVNGNALTRGIMKFCPNCGDGECFNKKALNYSEAKVVNRSSGHCWVMHNQKCPHNRIGDIIEDMYIARQLGWFGKVKVSNEFYVNPCFEENPTVHIKIEPEEAECIYSEILNGIEIENTPKCECGKTKEKNCIYCTHCKKQKARDRDKLKKKRKRASGVPLSGLKKGRYWPKNSDKTCNSQRTNSKPPVSTKSSTERGTRHCEKTKTL